MLQPRREKFRKQFRGKRRGITVRGSTLVFGDYGLKSLGRCWMTANQIEAARKAITHDTKREGKLWVRVFPDKPVTAKPAGKRMGSGKGDVVKHVAVVTPGRIIFELSGVTLEQAKRAMELAADKLPIKTKFIAR